MPSSSLVKVGCQIEYEHELYLLAVLSVLGAQEHSSSCEQITRLKTSIYLCTYLALARKSMNLSHSYPFLPQYFLSTPLPIPKYNLPPPLVSPSFPLYLLLSLLIFTLDCYSDNQ